MSRWLRDSVILLILSLAGTALLAAPFHFTVTADQRGLEAVYDNLLAQINEKIGGPGAFHVSPGDIDPTAKVRAIIDSRFGPDAIWFPGVGNHDTGESDINWIRAEYTTGNDERRALRYSTNRDGPMGSHETTYSWDYGNAHFIMLNQYWNGSVVPGSDTAGDGDTVDRLYNWLANNLARTRKSVIIVFGHEPAYPQVRHVGDSLDQYPQRRDRFWQLLESDPRVAAFICGHTHSYNRLQQPGGRVWQIDVGNAGNGVSDGQTFLDVTISDREARFDIWRDNRTREYKIEDTWSVPIGSSENNAD